MFSYIAIAAHAKIRESTCVRILKGERAAEAGSITYDRPETLQQIGNQLRSSVEQEARDALDAVSTIEEGRAKIQE